ncbi:MAG TPA: cytochrome C oxidase subunit IV family protein [Aggregatilineales bacterium]|nr:cytochrome C oxidase subunit IV family protein [Aggregatilineales bacterium]
MENNHPHSHGASKPTYNLVFVVLFVVTFLEILVSDISGVIGAVILLSLTCVKAGLVVAYYMHLKYDPPIYTWVFIVPMLMGTGVILSLQALAGY